MATKNFPDELLQLVTHERNTRLSAWLSGLSSVALTGCLIGLVVEPKLHHQLKFVYPGLGVAMAVASKLSSDSQRRLAMALEDIDDIGVHHRNKRLYEHQMDGTKALKGDKVEYFNWALLAAKVDKYPHIAIQGKSGSGKSRLAMWLCQEVLRNGITVAVDPHYKVGSYEGVNLVVAQRDGLDEGINLKQEPLPLSEILQGVIKPTVPMYIHSLWSEMECRLRLSESGGYAGDDEPYINTIFDEYSRYAHTKNVSKLQARMLRESRKAKIRNIYLLQDGANPFADDAASVANVTVITIGEAAINIAERKALEDPDQWRPIVQALRKEPVPCLIGDMVAKVPYTG